jgi:S-DNA-T family DNA segregation ATPase FtsK/SpoIIIE
MAKQQTKTNNSLKNNSASSYIKHISEGLFILMVTVSLFILAALITYDANDMTASLTYENVENAGGQVGVFIAHGLYTAFGFMAYCIPFFLGFFSWIILHDQKKLQSISRTMLMFRSIGLIALLLGGCGLLAFELQHHSALLYPGGIIGHYLALFFSYALNMQGATLLFLALVLTGVTWLTGLSWIRLSEVIGFYSLLGMRFLMLGTGKVIVRVKAKLQERATNTAKIVAPKKERTPVLDANIVIPKAKKEPTVLQLNIEEPTPMAKSTRGKPSTKSYHHEGLPSLELLNKGKPGKPMAGYTHQELENLSREVEQHLLDFGIQADVVSVHPGPVITRFELQLAAGVKVSKLTALAKDLARSLSVTSVRVVEIIPGKTVVGIELPNQDRAMVCLSEVLDSPAYQNAPSSLTLALGVDIAGHPMVVDLAKMPHLLVAGTTGSGKSVGINAMILSLLFKATPEQVRLIMIDPKMLELSIYDGIPHLLTPVVTDMKEAASSLRWCVAEMERRYKLMASLGVRNLAGFNNKIAEATTQGAPLKDPLWKPTDSMDTEAPLLEALPYIVVIIDELADMMMVVGKKVEQLIARIAQKARAAGIHLILATQRPSVDVLTGLIKSNIPTRISFQVSSKIDSRTILDQQGADQLLGHGDMLFLAPGTGAPLRVHGAFVDDLEVHRIADDWRTRGEPEYIDEITQNYGDNFEGGFGEEPQETEEADGLYDQALEFVVQTRKASISAVQRRFKIGYNRAARLVEEMERTGVVGPLEGGYREVLVSAVEE